MVSCKGRFQISVVYSTLNRFFMLVHMSPTLLQGL